MAGIAHNEGFLALRAQAAAAEENFTLGVVRQLTDSAPATAPADEDGRGPHAEYTAGGAPEDAADTGAPTAVGPLPRGPGTSPSRRRAG